MPRSLDYLAALDIPVFQPRTSEAGLASTDASPASPAAESESPPVVNPIFEADWEQLQARVASCQACALAETRHHTVFGVGSTQAKLMLVGEGPGAEEDRQGEPFVGAAGQLLNLMLGALGLQREQVYIANIVKCRPPGNRNPHASEAAACMAYLERQIELVRPKVLVALGAVAAHNLLKSELSVGQLRREHHLYTSRVGEIPLFVTYHPAYLLRQAEDKAKAWVDLQRVAQHLR